MGEAFRDKVRRLKKVDPRRPLSTEDQNAVVATVKSLVRQSATGSVGIITGPTGTHVARRRTPESGDQTKFAVVRSIGTGEEHFIMVQEIFQTDTTPWDGLWEIKTNDEAEAVNVYPTLKSKDYFQLLYRGSLIDRFTPVIEVRRSNLQWYAMQTLKWNLPKRETNPLLRWTDCTPREDEV